MKRLLVVIIILAIAAAGGTGQIASASIIPLTGASASYEQSSFGIGFAIDGSLDSLHGWAVNPNEQQSQWAIFNTAVQVATGSELTFTLSQLFLGGGNDNGFHLLRAFTLSVLDAGTNVWTVVTPTSATATSSLVINGNIVVNTSSRTSSPPLPATDAYVVKAQTPYSQIAGFRLDLIPPVGTQPSNSNFVLTEFSVNGAVVPEPCTFVVWSLLGTLGITLSWCRRRCSAA